MRKQTMYVHSRCTDHTMYLCTGTFRYIHVVSTHIQYNVLMCMLLFNNSEWIHVLHKQSALGGWISCFFWCLHVFLFGIATWLVYCTHSIHYEFWKFIKLLHLLFIFLFLVCLNVNWLLNITWWFCCPFGVSKCNCFEKTSKFILK